MAGDQSEDGNDEQKGIKERRKLQFVTCTATAEKCATLVTGEDYPRLIDPRLLVALHLGNPPHTLIHTFNSYYYYS